MNNDRDARIVAILFSVFFVLGMTYLGFGERLGIKSPGPNADLDNAYLAK